MKEKEFEDMGRRLYDLEADPPKNGWKKIGAAIAPPSTGVVGGFMWLSKHKKKFLFVAIPVSLYFMYPEQANEQTITTVASVDSMYNEEIPQVETSTSEVANSNKVESTNELEGTNKVEISKNAESSKKVESADQVKNSNKDVAISHERTSAEQKAIGRNEELLRSNLSVDNSTSGSQGQATNQTEESKTQEISPSLSNLNLRRENTVERIEESPAIRTARPKKETATDNNQPTSPSEQSRVKDQVVSTGYVGTESKALIPVSSKEKVVLVDQNEKKENTIATPHEVQTDHPGGESVGSSAFVVVEDLDSVLVVLDSLMEEQEADSLINQEELTPESKALIRKPWRITGSFTPLFTTRTVLPNTGDEILVTDVMNGTKQRIGSEFAIGVGKAITPQLYLDGQLLFLRTTQDIQYTYSTGLVDTLIAVQQPDNSVLVKPVYQFESREIDAVFNSGGIRLGVTYYFFQSQHGRFNATVTGGVNYTMSSSIRERINGEWIPVSGSAINKLNYNLRLSAGYSMKLLQGWELMANPTVSYYAKESGVSSLPYKMNQRSFGVMFMLSRTIGVR